MKKLSFIKVSRRIIKSLILIISVYAFVTITPNKYYMLIGLLATLAITLLFRTIFCGWVCPVGTMFDMVFRLGNGIRKIPFIKPLDKNVQKWIKKNRIILNKINNYTGYFRYLFFLWILQSAFLGIASIKSEGERGIVSVLYLFIALLVIGLFIERSWCKYVCPVGAILGLFSKVSPTRITRNPETCITCNLCSKICPMDIDVANKLFVKDINCHTCIKCVDICPVENALELKMQFPEIKQPIIETIQTKKKYSEGILDD
jgi:polyferredoxin